jgi:LacI family transcriptional regulator
MQKKAPTLKDVAERAGVSRMAVSAVLNNMQSTVRVSEATRQRIFAAMEDLRYQPDVTARSLRLQKTDTIGFYNGHGYIDMLDSFAPILFMGLQSAAAEFSNHLLLYNGFHLQPEDIVLQKLLSNKADGVVVRPAPSDENLILELGKTSKPVIQVVEAYPGAPGVIANDYAAARVLAEYLIERGHRRILFRRGATPLTSELARYRAFEDVAAERGVVLITTSPADRFDRLTDEERDLIVRHDAPDGFTAIACWHDASARQVIRFLDEQGIRVPDDLALTGFDGFTYREFGPTRPLTSVHVDWLEIAATSVRLLIDQVQGKEIPDRTIISGELRVGATT